MNDNFEDNNNFWNDIYDDKVYLDNTQNLYLLTERMKKEKKNNNVKYQNLMNLYNKYDYLIKEYCNEKNKNITTQTSFKNNKNNYFNILYNRGIAMNKKLEKIRKIFRLIFNIIFFIKYCFKVFIINIMNCWFIIINFF